MSGFSVMSDQQFTGICGRLPEMIKLEEVTRLDQTSSLYKVLYQIELIFKS